MSPYETIVYEEPSEGLGLMTFNRPERLNAMNMTFIEEVHDCLTQLEDSPATRVLIITGAGRGFCSGTDLKGSKERHIDSNNGKGSGVSESLTRQRRIADMIAHFRRIPQPVIAAINGVAAGGGFSIAMASDIRIAAATARFVASYINIGLGGGELGSSYFLARLIGLSRAAEILYTGRFVDAEEAERIGFVSRVVPEGQAVEAAMETARTMLAKSPFGLRMTKEVLNQTIDAPSLEAALFLENRTQTLATRTEDFSEAVQAFVDKREPAFSGS